MKRKKKSNSSRVLRTLMLLCAVGVLLSALVLFLEKQQQAKARETYRELLSIREMVPEEEDEGADLLDFTPLWEINSQVVAWISAEDTEIDYPVLRAEDNSYYMRRLITGEYNIAGSIFMDYRNRGDLSDKNTLIYGHNMKDETMFSALAYYKEEGYYEGHPFFFIRTPTANYRVELFAGKVVDGSLESVRLDFEDEGDFLNYVEALRSGSTFNSGLEVKGGDRLVTLSTCSYEFNNARYTVYGKLVLQK